MDRKFSSVDIFGVRIDRVTMDQAVEVVVEWIEGAGKYYIVTPNPEFVVVAQKDLEFKKVLNGADLAVADGVGLKLAGDVESIIPGVDLLERLCKEASEKGFTVGFLGGMEGVAKKASERLQKKYPGLKVVFAEGGGEVDLNGNVGAHHDVPETRAGYDLPLHIPSCDILFVAFGQVKQEKWIAQNLDKIPVKVAMGVGGSLDEISGKVLRVPAWIQKLGLKWLARLILQPWRIKRQLSLIKFVWMVLTTKKLKTV